MASAKTIVMLKTAIHVDLAIAFGAKEDIIGRIIHALNLQTAMKIVCGQIDTLENASCAITDTILRTRNAPKSNPLQGL